MRPERGLINEADLIIMVDFNSTSQRMGKAEHLVLASKAKKVMIDHHPDPGKLADLVISDVSRSSTSELVYFLVNGMEGSEFNDSDFHDGGLCWYYHRYGKFRTRLLYR